MGLMLAISRSTARSAARIRGKRSKSAPHHRSAARVENDYRAGHAALLYGPALCSMVSLVTCDCCRTARKSTVVSRRGGIVCGADARSGAALSDGRARVAHYAGARTRLDSAATMLRGAKRTLNTIRRLA